MHGHGKHILKQQTRCGWRNIRILWRFTSTKEYGGDAALILIEVEEWQPPELP